MWSIESFIVGGVLLGYLYCGRGDIVLDCSEITNQLCRSVWIDAGDIKVGRHSFALLDLWVTLLEVYFYCRRIDVCLNCLEILDQWPIEKPRELCLGIR